jgi:hypothetical protein
VVDDNEVNNEVTSVTSETIEDDNKLVTRDEIDSNEEETLKPNFWSDPERTNKLEQAMELLAKVRIPSVKIPEDVLLAALVEVIGQLGWKDYANFSQTIRSVLTGRSQIPFAQKTRNQRTGKMDFWLIRVFINVGDGNKDYEFSGKKYNKVDVLMSRQFCNYLRSYCSDKLKDEAQFWAFTGSYNGKQHLDMSKLKQDDMNALVTEFGEIDSNNLVLIQFKHKSAEVFVGRKVEGNA